MGLFSTRVTKQDFHKMRAGFGGDRVDVGDYRVVGVELRHIKPGERPALQGKGIFEIVMTVHDHEKFDGATLVDANFYHPSTDDPGLSKMNEITSENLVKVLDATGFDVDSLPEDTFNLEDVLAGAIPGARMIVTVSRDAKRPDRQNVGGYRPDLPE